MATNQQSAATAKEIERRTESVIRYLRMRVAPDDRLLQALLNQQAGKPTPPEPLSSAHEETRRLASRCGLLPAGSSH